MEENIRLLKATLKLAEFVSAKLRKEELSLDSGEDKLKIYLVATLTYLQDLGYSLLSVTINTGANILLRSLFEAVIKSLHLLYDERFRELFEYEWVRRQNEMNKHAAENPKRYSELLKDGTTEEYIKILDEAYEAKRVELGVKKIQVPDMAELTETANKTFVNGSLENYYFELYKMSSNTQTHYSLGLLFTYFSIEDEILKLKDGAELIRKEAYGISVGLIGTTLGAIDKLYDIGIEAELKELASQLESAGKYPQNDHS